MSYSLLEVDLTIFGNKVTLKPTTEIPTRLELRDSSITITKDKVKTLTDELVPIPGLPMPTDVDLTITQLVVDVETKEFKVGFFVVPDKDFFLNRFDNVFTLDKIEALIDVNPAAPEPQDNSEDKSEDNSDNA